MNIRGFGLRMATAVAAFAALAGAVPAAATILVNADITTSTVWTSDNEYELDKPIYVTNGATLTIEAGTVVRGQPATGVGTNDPGTLIITRGAKINAVGTPRKPIVFTDLDDDNIGANPGTPGAYATRADVEGLTGQWGGLILLSYGYVANGTGGGVSETKEVQIEGLNALGGLGFYGNCSAYLAGPYGRNCDDSDSGSVSYVSIRYGGFNLAANNEINGITLGAVGRETDLDYIEVYSTKDDFVEFFGGAPYMKHFIGAVGGDDGVDYDEGYRGKLQYVFLVQGQAGSGVDVDVPDKGGEHDGGNTPDESLPKSIPTIYNATYIGAGQKAWSKKDLNTVLHFRDNGGGRYYNSFFADFGGAAACIEGGTGANGSPTAANTSGERSVASYTPDGVYYLEPDSDFELELQDNDFWCLGNADILPTVGKCSVTIAQNCLTNADCPVTETCVNPPGKYGCNNQRHQDNGLFSNAALQNAYHSCASALPIRALTRTNSGNASTPDPVSTIDPLPVAASPLLTTDRTTAATGGFFDATSYKGAFGPNDNWARGWTTLSRLGYFPDPPTVTVSADIALSTTWTADNVYELDKPIYVTNGATLTIQPGTVVRGQPATGVGTNDPGTLIITRGAKINAVGTEQKPIVFTDLDDDNVGASLGTDGLYATRADVEGLTGQWGGLILLSYGYVANGTGGGVSETKEVQIEGLNALGGLGFYGNCSAYLAGPYGRNCDDSDSGSVSYVSIRYGGFNLAANNEINGITLGGVGRETDLDYIEVYSTKDDFVEFFGGAPYMKHFIGAVGGDDGVDYDEGYRGKLQYVFLVQGQAGSGVDVDVPDKGGEHDGGNTPDESLPKSIPTIYNATYIGAGQKAWSKKDLNTVLHFRDNGGGRYYNSFFADFGGAAACIEGGTGANGSPTAANTSGERSVASYTPDGVYYLEPDSDFELELQDDVFWCLGNANVLPTVGKCSVTIAQNCLTNADCPVTETCVNPPGKYGCNNQRHQDNGLFTTAALDNTYAACATPVPVQILERSNSGNASTPDPVSAIDPRPKPGSALASTNRVTPAVGGFFDAAPYKGAFAPGVNWTEGWSTLTRLGINPACSTTVDVRPNEVMNLSSVLLDRLAKRGWAWLPVARPGDMGYLKYDFIRSGTPTTFAGATFVETGDSDTKAVDDANPASGSGYYYLVRASNKCGVGTIGQRSNGTDRIAP